MPWPNWRDKLSGSVFLHNPVWQWTDRHWWDIKFIEYAYSVSQLVEKESAEAGKWLECNAELHVLNKVSHEISEHHLTLEASLQQLLDLKMIEITTRPAVYIYFACFTVMWSRDKSFKLFTKWFSLKTLCFIAVLTHLLPSVRMLLQNCCESVSGIRIQQNAL